MNSSRLSIFDVRLETPLLHRLKTQDFGFKTVCALIFLFFCAQPSEAQYRRAWVQRWDGGFATNSAVKMERDSVGNLVIAGTAQNASGKLEYAILKYSTNGALLWERRYGGGNGTDNVPRGLVLDINDNIYVTGTSATVKYTSAGVEEWTAPFAGRALALCLQTNVIVTGFSNTVFATVSLSALGATNQWLRTTFAEESAGYPTADFSQAVACSSNGTVYVSGTAAINWLRANNSKSTRIVSYDSSGTELRSYLKWLGQTGIVTNVLVDVRSNGEVISSWNARLDANNNWFATSGLTEDLDNQWSFRTNGFGTEFGGVIDLAAYGTSTFMCGQSLGEGGVGLFYAFTKLNENGSLNWFLRYGNMSLSDEIQENAATSIKVDSFGNAYTTGYLTRPSGGRQITTLKVNGTDGTVLWADEYDGGTKLDDEGRALVLDDTGNIYVAGVSAITSGGSEVVLIKYEPTQAAILPDGSAVVQFPGTPGQTMKVEGTTTLKPTDWVQIGLGLVPASGMFSVEDTNAVNYPFRFYRAIQNP